MDRSSTHSPHCTRRLSNAAGRPNGVGLLGRKWTVGPFLMRFPGGASFGARGRLAFRHRGAHRHRAARARHGEFGDFADPQQRQPETIVHNFLTGQYGNGLRIVAFNAAEGWSWDVSEDIALEILPAGLRRG